MQPTAPEKVTSPPIAEYCRGTPAWWMRLLLCILAVGVSLRLTLLLAPRSYLERLVPLFGLGPYPQGLAMDYLLRTTSVAYFLGGVFCWLVSRDLGGNKIWVLFLSWSTLLFGLFLSGVDLVFGGAARWQIGLGVGTMGLGIFMVALARRIQPEIRQDPDAAGKIDLAAAGGGGARALRLVLRCLAIAASPGIIGVLVPQSVLAHALEEVELRAFPTPLAPVMLVLLRSLFGTCFIGGVFFWLVSSKLIHHAWVARFLGWAAVFWGAVITLTDLGTALPWWLRMVAPLVVVLGSVIAFTAGRVAKG